MSAGRRLPMDIEKSTKFEIVTGERRVTDLEKVVPVGTATLKNGDEFYTLNLKGVVPRKLYLVKNDDYENEYTVFAGYDPTKKDDDRFLYPCGYGVLSSDLQSYMELDLYALDYPVFMSLHPTKEAA
jgi:hypothetical protein